MLLSHLRRLNIDLVDWLIHIDRTRFPPSSVDISSRCTIHRHAFDNRNINIWFRKASTFPNTLAVGWHGHVCQTTNLIMGVSHKSMITAYVDYRPGGGEEHFYTVDWTTRSSAFDLANNLELIDGRKLREWTVHITSVDNKHAGCASATRTFNIKVINLFTAGRTSIRRPPFRVLLLLSSCRFCYPIDVMPIRMFSSVRQRTNPSTWIDRLSSVNPSILSQLCAT